MIGQYLLVNVANIHSRRRHSKLLINEVPITASKGYKENFLIEKLIKQNFPYLFLFSLYTIINKIRRQKKREKERKRAKNKLSFAE